jgi:hypothetical protein
LKQGEEHGAAGVGVFVGGDLRANSKQTKQLWWDSSWGDARLGRNGLNALEQHVAACAGGREPAAGACPTCVHWTPVSQALDQVPDPALVHL